MSCRPLLRAFSRSIVVGPLQVIAVFLALMGFMVVKNKGKAKAFVKSFMSFEGPAGLLVAPSKAHFPSHQQSAPCHVQASLFWSSASKYGCGSAPPSLSIVVLSCSHICGDSYQDIVGDAFFVLGMNKHAEKDWVSDLLMP